MSLNGFLFGPESDMTQEEASKLRNANGKNLNGGKYDNPNTPEDVVSSAIKGIILIAFLVFLGFQM